MLHRKLLTPEQLSGVYAKLERVDESIKDLDSEIAAFLRIPEGKLSKDKQEAFGQFLQHARRDIPPRLGVLAGEIAHQLRSCLDHIVWALSSEDYRQSSETAIAFPVFTEKPRNKREETGYKRKIQGITDTAAVELVELLQPYHAENPIDEPLAIIHELDRVDKHHTLVLIESSWDASLKIPLSMFNSAVISGIDVYDNPLPAVPPTNKMEVKFTHQVALSEFGRGKTQAVIPGLTKLTNATKEIVRRFAEL